MVLSDDTLVETVTQIVTLSTGLQYTQVCVSIAVTCNDKTYTGNKNSSRELLRIHNYKILQFLEGKGFSLSH